MLRHLRSRAVIFAVGLCAGAGLLRAAESPDVNPQKPVTTVVRPTQIEPIVAPVKRAAPQEPENKAKASEKIPDTAKKAATDKASNSSSKTISKTPDAKAKDVTSRTDSAKSKKLVAKKAVVKKQVVKKPVAKKPAVKKKKAVVAKKTAKKSAAKKSR